MELEFGKSRFEMRRLVPDLEQQHAFVGQVGGCIGDDPPNQIHAVAPAGQRGPRLGAEFRRQRLHRRFVDIGRVAQDQVEAVRAQRREQVSLDQFDALLQSMVFAVGRGQRQRIGREVGADHLRVGKAVGGEDREAAAAGAQVEDRGRPRRPSRVQFEPLRQRLVERFGDQRARHQRARIASEAHPAQPGLAGEVGRRRARRDAVLDELGRGASFGARQPGIEPGIEHIGRQVQRPQQQRCRLVAGVVGAVAMDDSGGLEARDRPAQQVAQRAQLARRGIGAGQATFEGRAHARSSAAIVRR